MPPLLEYMDSLLTGTGHDLELRTFKVVDQLSGRMMGVRADITPQVARIDAHLLNRKGVTRLCYCGSVLHTRPRGAGRDARADPGRRRDVRRGRRRRRRRDARAPLPGARASPARATRASTSATSRCSAPSRTPADVGRELEAELFEALQRKDVPALTLADAQARRRRRATRCCLLPNLYGGAEVLDEAEKRLPRIAAGDRAPSPRCAGSPRPASSPPASTSPSCAATTTTPAWCSTPIATASPARSRAAGATMRSERPSAARDRPPASPSTEESCG